MKKINWKQKLTSRKFWAAVVGFVTPLLIAFGVTETETAQDHHTVVRAVTSAEKGIGIYKPRDMESVDALITNEKGVTLVTF